MTDELVTFHQPSDSAVTAQIELKATPDKVYNAWTQPDVLAKWFGPRADGHLQIDHFDCSVGGRFDLTMVFADGDRVQIIGTYQELDLPKKIVFTWQWTDLGNSPLISNETLVTVDLAPSQAGTHLTLTHERFVSVDARNQHQSGWGMLLVRLAALLTN